MKLMKVTDPQRVLDLIATSFAALPGEQIKLEDAGGRCLAGPIQSPEDVPSFNRSTVDGYAVAARDTFGAGEGLPAILECVGEVLMGQEAPSITREQCVLIHTGGMLPPESDAVIMIEETEATGTMVQCFRQVAPGENVIHRGEDLQKGAAVLAEGHFLRAPEIGLLASVGITEIKVHRQPVVGFFSSGDELVDYHSHSLETAKIRDSNAPALLHLAAEAGADARYGGILPDRFAVFLEKSRAMLKEVDFLVFSGGSSVGSRDFTARTMNELGKPGLLVEGISVQPGKPTLLADCEGKPVLGLPGHPVSALNIFSIFGRAIIDCLSGRVQKPYIPTVTARLARNIPSRSGRTDYIRIRIEQVEDGFKAFPLFGRSGMLRPLAEADGLLVVPSSREGLREGESVEV
ncbi:MAG TPA: molybdopterin molybdenumtransferase MoeA [Firmicutes bacterium]|nr:molybdopterin molybdenumtransferase MoeA [Bacillota bacterium]